MKIQFRDNCDILNFGADYFKIRDFLVELNYPTYLHGRWDWMVTHGYLDKSGIPKIAVWEDEGDIVALATYDCGLGDSYFCVKDGFEALKKEMLVYSMDAFRDSNGYAALIPDSDAYFQNIASELGFRATQDREFDAVYPIDISKIDYKLPEGFLITSLKDNYDLYKYGKVLWKGFNHEQNGEGEFNPADEDVIQGESEMKRPNVDLNLKIAVAAPNGDFVSYCGMWKDEKSDYALVEPVATDPAYRKMGLGKAAVLEGIRRCGLLGAKKAYVGSSQQFYYSIGFRPHLTSTWWKN